MQSGSKRRRTKRQIEEDKEDAIRREEETVASMAELAELRARVHGLEEQAAQGTTAASLLSQMIMAGHVVQDSEDSVIVHSATGQHRFGAHVPHGNDDGN